MRKKYINIIISILLVSIIIVGIFIFAKPSNTVSNNPISIGISIYDKEENLLYDEDIQTSKEYLADVLKEARDENGLQINIVDDKYGAYVTAIIGIEQGDGYYWTYYVNGEYASVGASNYKIKENDEIEFKIEKFEEE